MRLSESEARTRLHARDHGVLCTVHPRRGVDPIPVVYAVAGGHVGVPVDRVKAKSDGRLQRERNLAGDPRAALLVEHWERDEWSRLWWVRAELRATQEPSSELSQRLADGLAERFDQYRDRPFARMLVLAIGDVTGWAAASD